MFDAVNPEDGWGALEPAELLLDAPCGSYLLEQKEAQLILWRIAGDEPDEDELAPAGLWPLLLPELVG